MHHTGKRSGKLKFSRWCMGVGKRTLHISYAFSQRTVNEWNKLPGECVNAASINMFKNKLL